MKKLLSNGTIWQPDGFIKSNLLVEDGIITDMDANLSADYAKVIDCKGIYILPTIADMHVHVGEQINGLDLADDFASLNKLASVCGINAIGAFITEHPDNPKKQKSLTEQYEKTTIKAESDFQRKVHWHLTPIQSSLKDIMPLLKGGCDLKFYTTYKSNGLYKSYTSIATWMKELKDLKPRILVHCEDDEVVTVMSAFNPFHRPFDHTKRRPEMAEILAVERILDLAIQHDYPVHIVHVSTPEAALLIKQARMSAPVTCETAPHYLLLNEDKLKDINGHRWLCTPPLRSEKSRGLMIELLQDGLFDAVTTDHCPFNKADKDKFWNEPGQVPMGIPGLGATFALLYENLVKTEKLGPDKLMSLISANPARLMNLGPEYVTISTGARAEFIFMQEEPLSNPVPVLASLADTWNPWQDFTHTLNYYFFEDTHGSE